MYYKFDQYTRTITPTTHGEWVESSKQLILEANEEFLRVRTIFIGTDSVMFETIAESVCGVEFTLKSDNIYEAERAHFFAVMEMRDITRSEGVA